MVLHKIIHGQKLITNDFGALFDQLTRVNSKHAPQGHKIQLVQCYFEDGRTYSSYHKIIVSRPATEAEIDAYNDHDKNVKRFFINVDD